MEQSALATVSLVDLALLIGVIIAMWVGWRQGAISTVMGIVGVVAGGFLAIQVMPYVMDYLDEPMAKLTVGLATFLLLVIIGFSVGASAGQSLRNVIRTPVAIGIDAGLGAVVRAITFLVVTWVVLTPLATVLPGRAGDEIRDSKVLDVVGQLTPEGSDNVMSTILGNLTENGMPLIAPQWDTNQPDVPADPSVISQEVVDRVRPSIVRVMGEAQQCQRLLQGTGFVVGENMVVTNAHVVAGAETVRMETVAGLVDADVVYYDPLDDIAVLYSWDLPLTPITWAGDQMPPGTDAVVLGFPESGPFKATAARVNTVLTIRGADIYSQGQHDRQAYVLRSDVRHGNSGGPLMTTDGRVFGLIFGAGINNDETGYALTERETREAIDAATGLTAPVGTGACVVN